VSLEHDNYINNNGSYAAAPTTVIGKRGSVPLLALAKGVEGAATNSPI